MPLKIRNILDGWEDCKKIIVGRAKEPELPLVSLPLLNKKIWGLRKGRLTVIGARTSQGKSAFVSQVACDLSSQGKSVLFLSLEMCQEEMHERILCYTQRIDNYHLLTGHYDTYEEKITNHPKEISKWSLSFSDCIGKTWKEIDDFLIGIRTKPDVIILDYVQAIKGTGKNDKENLDEYIRHFREMAIRHNFAGILCSQVNRANQDNEDKEPKLHQLKGTGVLEEHADVVILLYWKDKTKKDYQIEVAKNRNGRTGYIKLNYTPEYYLFTECEEEIKTVDNFKQQEIPLEWSD